MPFLILVNVTKKLIFLLQLHIILIVSETFCTPKNSNFVPTSVTPSDITNLSKQDDNFFTLSSESNDSFITSGNKNLVTDSTLKTVPTTSNDGRRCQTPTQGGNSAGAHCAFPFIFKGEIFETCTPLANNGVLWCAVSSNYDSDGIWGNCIGKKGLLYN